MRKFILTFLLLCTTIITTAYADFIPLPAEQAFQFSVTLEDKDTLVAHWEITPGYYLYKDRISFKILDSETVGLGPIKKPAGINQQDPMLGTYKVYDGTVDMRLPLQYREASSLTLLACFQGCSFNHFCYPPITKKITIDPTKDIGKTLTGVSIIDEDLPSSSKVSEQDKIHQLLATHHHWLIILSFFGFGLLLSFTPCVLPMLPILSGIILGHEKGMTIHKGFFLSLAYVLGMAVTYAVIGVIAGFAGHSLQAAMQNPWVISVFSFIFVLLALSLFGLFEIRLPDAFELRLRNLSNQQRHSYIGVAIMGILSTLIVSPCVTAPLIGALAYIGETKDAVLGGIALFVMSLGMGIPLLILGTLGGKFLPKAGQWMLGVKSFFGILMLAVAIWMISRIIPGAITLLLWATLLIVCSVFLGLLNNRRGWWGHLCRGFGLVLLVAGILLMIGAALGNTDPFRPLANLNVRNRLLPSESIFTMIKTPTDLSHELTIAKNQNKPTLLDFYADWCIACKDMARTTFADPAIQKILREDFVALQADVTDNDKIDKLLQRQLNVIAPPTLLFFDPDGHELKNQRIVGEINPAEFEKRLHAVLQAIKRNR